MKKLAYTLLICFFTFNAFAEVINKTMINGKEVKILDNNNILIHPTKSDVRVFDFELIVTIKGKQKIAKTNEQVISILNNAEVKGSSAVLHITKATDKDGKNIKVDDVLLTIE